MRRVHVRCSLRKCSQRATLAKHPDAYKVPRRCTACGGTRFRVIKDRTKDRNAKLCDCAGRVYGDVRASNYSASMPPHRRGSPQCFYNRDGSERPFEPCDVVDQ